MENIDHFLFAKENSGRLRFSLPGLATTPPVSPVEHGEILRGFLRSSSQFLLSFLVLAKSPALRSEKRPHVTYSPRMPQRNREAQGQTQHAPIINLKEFLEQIERTP
jgi:hypothetical protein